MMNPENRKFVQNSVLSRSSFNGVYNNALQEAAALSLEAREKTEDAVKQGDPHIDEMMAPKVIFYSFE